MGLFSKISAAFKHGIGGKLGNVINSRNLANVLPIASIYTSKGRSELLNNSIWVKYGKGIAASYTGGASSTALGIAQGIVNGPTPSGGGGGVDSGGANSGVFSPQGSSGQVESSFTGIIVAVLGGLVLIAAVLFYRRH